MFNAIHPRTAARSSAAIVLAVGALVLVGSTTAGLSLGARTRSSLNEPPVRIAASAGHRGGLHRASAVAEGTQAAKAREPQLALRGHDPVALTKGREEPGQASMTATHAGYRYRFANEANRVTFTREPARYAIQNDTCLVVPGATIDPELFVVHDGRIFGFASADCVQEFKAAPESYLTPTKK